MFMITLSFLVFSGSNFEAIEGVVISMMKVLAGGDMTAEKQGVFATFGSQYLDEMKTRQFLAE